MPEAAPTPGADASTLWASQAWLPGGWHDDVLLSIGADGCWAAVTPGVARPPAASQVLAGPLLPGLVNAHSHAFQRAFAGLAERRETPSDDFWSWRKRMYGVALRITPEQLRAVAAQLYVELLHGGYTQVCEFHYLQHDRDGRPYADPLELSWAVADAAAEAGIGLTMLPVLYERAGFAKPGLGIDQRRFRASAADVWAMHEALAASGRPLLNAGVAIHSLRGATAASIAELRQRAQASSAPIHVHVAEQRAEVADCIVATGARPIEWLASEGFLDARWQLVHATHSTHAEIDAVARSGAGVVLCPGTEANLGDGLCDLEGWLGANVPVAIGSDSHVTRAWCEELRWLDYGQRLALGRRNVGAAPQIGVPSTAERLYGRALAGSGAAAGATRWGLEPGARADALVVDTHDAGLLGIEPARTLDALVFSSPGRPWRDVMVAGRWVVREHRHSHGEAIGTRFAAAMREVWAEALP